MTSQSDAAVAVAIMAGSTWWAATHSRSAAVRGWQPSPLPSQRAGRLHVRTAGSGDTVTVLLHGLVATGDIFGAPFDRLADNSTLVVPDLLGFGRSLDESRSQFTPEDHLDALDEALEVLGLSQHRIVVGAHSMGSALAIRWLERRGDQLEAIACFGPPVYPNADAVDATIAAEGLMARAFVANTKWAELACRLNCSHRTAAGIAAALVTPELPWQLAKAASLHTWPAYRDAMDLLIPDTDWTRLTKLADDLDVAVTLTWGSDDRIGDRAYAARLPGAQTRTVADAGHHLPLTHANLCVEQLLRRAP